MKYCYSVSPNYTLNSTSRYFCTLFPLLLLFLSLSTDIGKFSGCCKKVYPFSRVSGLRLPSSVSFYKKPQSDFVTLLTRFCSLRVRLSACILILYIYTTTDIRDGNRSKPLVANIYRDAFTLFFLLPLSHKERK